MQFFDELVAFRARTTDPGYAALILLGTGQATTAALLIGTLDVQRVAFLLTKETRTMPDDVAQLLGYSSDTWLSPDGDHSTTLDVYRGLRNVLDQWHDLDRSKIAADVTGGLKPMSVGLEKAAHVLGLQTIYIQSEYEQQADGRSVPKKGSQHLIIPPDPYIVFGDLEAAEARRLFRAHDYAGAGRMLQELAERVPDSENADYQALAILAQMYAAWDVLDFQHAAEHAEQLGRMLSSMHALHQHATTLERQRAVLRSLATVSTSVMGHDGTALQTLADPKSVLQLLGTLHTSAHRRSQQGRYDFAALFRYRCLELISQHRLATHGLLTSKPNYDVVSGGKTALGEAFKTQQQIVQAQRSSPKGQIKGLPSRITLFDGYMLLAALEDPLVREYEIRRIEERSQARNTSVLAHGYRLINQTEYQSFAEVVDEVLERLFTHVLQHDQQEWERIHQFIDLFA